MAKGTTAVYLYCVVRAARKPSLERVPAGLAGATRPEAHRLAGSLWLITANVPLGVYGPEHLEAHLRDLEWVSETAIAHEALVQRFARGRGAVVIPMKLFTMFSSLEKAIEEVGQGRATIERVMKHIAGSEEWGIRIARKPAVAAAMAAGTSRPTSGAAFLAARKEARDATASLRTAAVAAADAAYDRLARHAKNARRRERRQEPGANPPVLEAAFLVAAAARARFKAEARRQSAACAAAGAELTLTGPWPAYNFVAPEGHA
jgi:hypothetical protein